MHKVIGFWWYEGCSMSTRDALLFVDSVHGIPKAKKKNVCLRSADRP